MSKGRSEAALKSLRRLGYRDGQEDRRLADIQRTLEAAKQENDHASYLECFRRSNLRRTIISVMPLIIQSASGVVFMVSYTLYYAQLAGFNDKLSFQIQITTNVLAIAGNIVSWFVIDRFGRRASMIYGLGALVCVLMVMGGLAVVDSPQALVGAVSMCLLFSFFYNIGVGAAAFTIVAESATQRLRVKTIAVGLSLQASLNTAWSFSIPYIINPDRANLGGRIGFIFGGVSILMMVYLYFYQPETTGRSYAEMDEMFMKRVPARKFAKFRTEIQEQSAQSTGAEVAR
jgi:MFS transporter, SP family, general alpha glucoside:H+ symporter